MMTDTSASQNLPKNPDPQVKGVSGNDMTHHQGQQLLPDMFPQNLADWLARINRR